MKSAKKAIIAAVCAVMLVVGSVAGTMAYLTSQDSVTNTFTVGNVTITLDEADVDENGNKILTTEGKDVERVDANSYKLMPGHEYTKDPIVHVASNSEDCYLFVKVVNGIADIEDNSNNGAKTVASQMANKGWEAVQGQTGVYVYTQTDESSGTKPAVVAKNTNVTVFENFTISGTVDNTTLATYKDKTITVTAYAIQADGFNGKNASEIWTAGWGNNGTTGGTTGA